MKKIPVVLALTFGGIGAVLGQETPPPIGTIVPDGANFTVSATPASELVATFGRNDTFSDLVPHSYSDFEGEIVVTVHYAPW